MRERGLSAIHRYANRPDNKADAGLCDRLQKTFSQLTIQIKPNTLTIPGKSLLLSSISGILLFLATPGTFAFGSLAWFALVPLLIACRDVAPRHAALYGLVTGFLYYVAILYWIVTVLHTYGYLPLWIAVAALLLLALYMSLYLSFFAAGVCWMMQRVSPVWIAPAFWVALDVIRAHLFTGFPWQDLAYSQYNHPGLIQIADLTGHHGVTFLIVLVNVLLFSAITLLRRNSFYSASSLRKNIGSVFLPAAILLIAATAYNSWRVKDVQSLVANTDSLSMSVIQGNIDQNKKWQPGLGKEIVNKYIALSIAALDDQKSSLLLWPETAVPYYLLENQTLQVELAGLLLNPYQVNLLTGAPHRELNLAGDTPLFNSAFIISPAGAIIGRYDKQHLVPFGEYIPLRQFLPFSTPIVESMYDFSSGSSKTPIACLKARIGVFICFESIFPELIRKQVIEGATVLANLTNDAWFGRSSAPWQHLSMAVFRAVETKRSLARSANTGISCFVDPLGRLSKISPLFKPFFLSALVPLLTEETFYVRYGHHFGALILFLFLPLAALAGKKKKRKTLDSRIY